MCETAHIDEMRYLVKLHNSKDIDELSKYGKTSISNSYPNAVILDSDEEKKDIESNSAVESVISYQVANPSSDEVVTPGARKLSNYSSNEVATNQARNLSDYSYSNNLQDLNSFGGGMLIGCGMILATVLLIVLLVAMLLFRMGI